MGQPEAYIGHAGNQFLPDGQIGKTDTRQFVINFLNAFARWAETNHAKSAGHIEPMRKSGLGLL